jgi:hypothetical protein
MTLESLLVPVTVFEADVQNRMAGLMRNAATTVTRA